MVKKKRDAFKKIIIVICMASLLISSFAITSSADNIVLDDKFIQVRQPYFCPKGVVCSDMYGTSEYSNLFVFDVTDFVSAKLDAIKNTSYSWKDRASMYNEGAGGYSNLQATHTLSYSPDGEYKWNTVYDKTDIAANLYQPNHTWYYNDMIVQDGFTYKQPQIYYWFENAPSTVYVKFDFDIVCYDSISGGMTLTHFTYNATVKLLVQGNRSGFTLSIIDFNLIKASLRSLGLTTGIVKNYKVNIKTDKYNPTAPPGSQYSRVYSCETNSFIDAAGNYPDIKVAINELRDKSESGGMPDMSSWIISGISGFLNAPIFGQISIGMIFVSILGLWFTVIFIKKFAGG